MAGAAPGGQAAIPGMNLANPMQQASLAQQGALAGTATGLAFDPGTLAQTNIGQYQNPYTQQVIDMTQADILRGAQMGLNELGAQATRARAFGGSRQGVAEAELGRNVLQQLAQTSAQQRQSGFQSAQQMAQQDIQNRMAAQQGRLGAAAQLGALGQQSFGFGRTIQQDLAQQGAQQQALQQALIDAAKGQFAGYTGAPAAGLGYTVQALGAAPTPVTTTQSKQPGLFDYLTLAATARSGG